MYTAYYHLHHKPFSLLPDSEGLYLGATHRAAYSSLEVDTREAYSFGFLADARYDVDYLRAFGQIGLCYRTLGHISQAVAAFRKACADCGAPRAYNLRVRYLPGRTRRIQMIFRADRTFKDTAMRLSSLEGNRRRAVGPPRAQSWDIGQAWTHIRQLLKGNN